MFMQIPVAHATAIRYVVTATSKQEITMSNNRVPAVRLGVLGAILWVIGVEGIRLAAPSGAFTARFAVLALLAAVPMAWGTVRLARRIGERGGAGVLESVALVALPAALLDGAALTWAPSLYAAAAADQRAAAAWLLWFLGASFAMALVMSPKRATPIAG
jgi:hypothetical protein